MDTNYVVLIFCAVLDATRARLPNADVEEATVEVYDLLETAIDEWVIDDGVSRMSLGVE